MGVAGLDAVRTPDALNALRVKHAKVSKAVLELLTDVGAVERAYEAGAYSRVPPFQLKLELCSLS